MPDTSYVYQEGIEELTWAIGQVQTPESKLIFDETLPLKYGAFYMGWTTYLLGSKLKVQVPEDRNEVEVALFKKNCRMIQFALEQQELPYLESYRGNTWPADGIIAVSALQLNNTYLDGNMHETIKDWLLKVKDNLDKIYGLIPHKVSHVTGDNIGGVRGCSQSLILNFMNDIDPSFAKEQFNIYKSLFIDTKMGLYGVREYPKGEFGLGDVDSGPVILGVGASASVVGQRTLGVFGEYNLYREIRNNIEGFGFAYTTSSNKKYLFGQMPMMDAFFAWSNTLEDKTFKENYTRPIKWTFHLISLMTIFVFLFLFYRVYRKF